MRDIYQVSNTFISGLLFISSSHKFFKNLINWSYYYRQLCLIGTDVDPKYLSGLNKIQVMRIGIICIERDRDLPIWPV